MRGSAWLERAGVGRGGRVARFKHFPWSHSRPPTSSPSPHNSTKRKIKTKTNPSPPLTFVLHQIRKIQGKDNFRCKTQCNGRPPLLLMLVENFLKHWEDNRQTVHQIYCQYCCSYILFVSYSDSNCATKNSDHSAIITWRKKRRPWIGLLAN